MKIDIRSAEEKITSQNGEDGVLMYLHSLLRKKNSTFVEIGCADGKENNSLNLTKNGLSGIAVDANWNLAKQYADLSNSQMSAGQLVVHCMRVTAKNCAEIIGWAGLEPDIFSLDIDSYDFFILIRLLELGFCPSIICVETNSFLGESPVTVDYIENFSRYELQPNFGLYFGASPNAWRNLFLAYGYVSLGMESSGTNMFFIRENNINEPQYDVIECGDIHQVFFQKKYDADGATLSQNLLSTPNLSFLNTQSEAFNEKYNRIFAGSGKENSATFVTTFTKSIYEDVAHKLVSSFEERWPRRFELLALSEGCNVHCPSERVKTGDLAVTANGLQKFKKRHRFNPGANGHFGSLYNYVFDCVKWSHKVFAVEVAAEYTDAEILVYIDSDIYTFEKVPDDFLSSLLPENTDIAFMPRKEMYSECSFVIYRLRNPYVRQFIFEHADAYRSDRVFHLSGWTDCHIFDALVSAYQNQKLLQFHNINSGIPDSMHPFINGPLGAFMDHMKGARKEEGRSYDSDLVVDRSEAYWRDQGLRQ